MTTMMDWEETSPSPGGSASGSSLNGHSEAEEETIIGVRSSNHVTTLNLKINCSYTTNSSSSNSSDKKPYFPATSKENSLLLNDGFNGLNLNPSPPSAGQNLSISSTTASSFHHSLTRSSNNSIGSSSVLPASKVGGHQNTSSAVASGSGIQISPSSTSGVTTSSGKKNKPIPPPLDLSIGASSLNSSSSSSSSSTGSGTFQYPGTFYSPYYHLGSPKFNQAEKTLPLRKRWHSWSPKLMYCNEDLIPLYADPPLTNAITVSSSGSGTTRGDSNGAGAEESAGSSNSHYGGNNRSNTLQPPSYSVHGGRGHGPSGNGNATPQSAGLQTPTPFYTPNEPSPRFMNSPVFSYSTPDTTLYQGPYSPLRTTTLYPPGSPFLNSSLNTPTFVITNVSPPSAATNSASNTTIGVGASSSGSTASSSSSSSLSPNAAPSMSVIVGPSPGFHSQFPISLLSPASSSQASSSQSYDDSHDPKPTYVLPVPPIWNIFMPGTKIRFIGESGQTTGWYLVDYLSQLNDLSAVLGFGIKGDYAPNGLSVKQYVVTSSARERVQITFTPANNEQHHPNIEADCEAGHPFMVMKKGVCAVKPERFAEVYGSHGMKLEMLDVCINLNIGGTPKQVHTPTSSAFMSNGICSIPAPLRNGHGGSVLAATANAMMTRSLIPPISLGLPHTMMDDIKPNFEELQQNMLGEMKAHAAGMYMEDIKPFAHPIPTSVISGNHRSPQSCHLDLNQQLKQNLFQSRMDTEPSLPILNGLNGTGSSGADGKKSKGKARVKKNKESNNNSVSNSGVNSQESKGRRPMNAFLVYAKEQRPLLIQKYPGKDNRSISTILGDSWKNLDPDQKNFYIKTAKDSADEQKKMHPDCWKRKRSSQHQSNGPPMKMEVLTKS